MGDTQFIANNLKGPVHFIGIGGIGMSALARILLDRGVKVSGSDLAASYVTEMLEKAGAKVFLGHSANHIPEGASVVFATGVSESNPEYRVEKENNRPLFHRSDLLVAIAHDFQTIAVAGTHGKTTTSALLAHVLLSAGDKPAFAIGGLLPQYGSNGGDGKGSCFVIEACESDGTFLKYSPFGGIVTNIGSDHLGYFGSKEALQASFFEFMELMKSPEHFFWCGDDPVLRQKSPAGISYGFDKGSKLRLSNFSQEGWKIVFDIHFQNKFYEGIEVLLIGHHNALNAAAVFGLALSLGVPEKAIRDAFMNFEGVKRRCERKGEFQGMLFLDDYAHHPVEIKTTLEGIRQAIGQRRLIAIYQPHRYTRTVKCVGFFGGVFDAADRVILTEIYAAGESPIEGITNQKVFEDISASNTTPIESVTKGNLIDYLEKCIQPYDVIVTLGAGDITKINKQLLERLENHPSQKMRVGVVFGGRSVEHEVSLVSARNVVLGLDRERYDIQYFGISKEGVWISGTEAQNQLNKNAFVEAAGEKLSGTVLQALQSCAILFPVLHGPFGEDGTIQGFFETLALPYVGCCHRSAAICMDKALTKELMLQNQVPTVEFVSLTYYQWKCFKDSTVQEVLSKFSFPLFVKPVHLGSTLGVRKVSAIAELIEGINMAFQCDSKIIIEKAVVGREIEFAVLGNEQVTVFNPGEVLTNGQVYDYAAKYGSEGTPVAPKAELSSLQKIAGKALAKKAYEIIGCRGMARVDFFLDGDGGFWLNEVNPIPGFTANSLYPLICQANGLEFSELLDKLILLGLQCAEQKKAIRSLDESIERDCSLIQLS